LATDSATGVGHGVGHGPRHGPRHGVGGKNEPFREKYETTIIPMVETLNIDHPVFSETDALAKKLIFKFTENDTVKYQCRCGRSIPIRQWEKHQTTKNHIAYLTGFKNVPTKYKRKMTKTERGYTRVSNLSGLHLLFSDNE
jgi:hypothetical protein